MDFEKIHEFALKYLNLYQNPSQAKRFEDFEENFASICFSLDFKMDSGKSFVEKFPSKAAWEVEEFEKISDKITDAKFLGTAIFSKWRYITHWLEKFSFENKFRQWFISAFQRLSEITDKNFLQEVGFMFNKEIFENYLATYKKDFPTWFQEEKYKWEMVKHFQDNFDLNAENFYEMLKRSLAKTSNLLAGGYYLPRTVLVNMFAKNEPETVRKMLRELFDEKNNIWLRIDNFKSQSNNLFEKYGNANERHHQMERAISTYLWLKYPDKYYIYKITDLQKITKKLNSDLEFISGDYENNIEKFYKFYDKICEELKKDAELTEILKNNLTENCYPDTESKTLTQDFGFYISKH